MATSRCWSRRWRRSARRTIRRFQIVFGLQDAADPALHVVRRLRARFPHVDIEVVIDPAQHGVNRKISNLINMYPRPSTT